MDTATYTSHPENCFSTRIGENSPFSYSAEWRTPSDCRLKVASFKALCSQGSYVTAYLPRSPIAQNISAGCARQKGECLAIFADTCPWKSKRPIMRTEPGCCCSHVPELLLTLRLCPSDRQALRPATRGQAGFDSVNRDYFFMECIGVGLAKPVKLCTGPHQLSWRWLSACAEKHRKARRPNLRST